MEFDRLTSRPVVKSATSAQSDWERWLYENHFQRLLDGDGLDWNLDLKVMPYPDDSQIRGTKWAATISLYADVSAEDFIKTNVLFPERDERLIQLIGNHKVSLKMRPTTHEAHGEKEAREMMVKILPELRENILKTKMVELKRTLIARWIDENMMFGQREALELHNV